MDDAVGQVEVAVVVGDHDQQVPLGAQLGQQLGVEEVAEGRVLVRGPFVEHHDRAALEVGMHQREALALAGGQIDGAEGAVPDAHLVGDFQALQVGARGLGQGRHARPALACAGQVLEEVEVREHGGEKLPVVVARLGGDGHAVDQHLALLRGIQAQQQLDEGGLARAVVAHDEDHFAAAQLQVHGAEREGLAAVGGRLEGVAHALQRDAFVQHGGGGRAVLVQVGLRRGEARRQVGDAQEGHLGAAHVRQRGGDLVDGPLEEEQHQREAAEHGRLGGLEGGPAEDHGDEQEEQRGAEGGGGDVGVDGAAVDLADPGHDALHLAAQHAGAALAVHAQFLGAFADGAVGLVQAVFVLAGLPEAFLGPGLRHHLEAGADGQRQHHQPEERQGQPGHVHEAAQHHGRGDERGRQHEGGVADHVHVLRQHGHEPVGAVALQRVDGGRQDFPGQADAHLRHQFLADVVGGHVGHQAPEERGGAQGDEGPQQAAGHAAVAVQHFVDRAQQQHGGDAGGQAAHGGECDPREEGPEEPRHLGSRGTRSGGCSHAQDLFPPVGGWVARRDACSKDAAGAGMFMRRGFHAAARKADEQAARRIVTLECTAPSRPSHFPSAARHDRCAAAAFSRRARAARAAAACRACARGRVAGAAAARAAAAGRPVAPVRRRGVGVAGACGEGPARGRLRLGAGHPRRAGAAGGRRRERAGACFSRGPGGVAAGPGPGRAGARHPPGRHRHRTAGRPRRAALCAAGLAALPPPVHGPGAGGARAAEGAVEQCGAAPGSGAGAGDAARAAAARHRAGRRRPAAGTPMARCRRAARQSAVPPAPRGGDGHGAGHRIRGAAPRVLPVLPPARRRLLRPLPAGPAAPRTACRAKAGCLRRRAGRPGLKRPARTHRRGAARTRPISRTFRPPTPALPCHRPSSFTYCPCAMRPPTRPASSSTTAAGGATCPPRSNTWRTRSTPRPSGRPIPWRASCSTTTRNRRGTVRR